METIKGLDGKDYEVVEVSDSDREQWVKRGLVYVVPGTNGCYCLEERGNMLTGRLCWWEHHRKLREKKTRQMDHREMAEFMKVGYLKSKSGDEHHSIVNIDSNGIMIVTRGGSVHYHSYPSVSSLFTFPDGRPLTVEYEE